MKQGPCIDCGESRLRSALKIAGGSLSGGGSLGGPSLYVLSQRFGVPYGQLVPNRSKQISHHLIREACS